MGDDLKDTWSKDASQHTVGEYRNILLGLLAFQDQFVNARVFYPSAYEYAKRAGIHDDY